MCSCDSETQTLFSKVHETYHSKIPVPEKVPSIQETFQEDYYKKVPLLYESYSEISETGKKKFLQEPNLCMTEKVPCLLETYSKIMES